MKGSSAMIAAVGAYSPAAASSSPRCGKCGEYVTLTPDAIGNLRERCPKCDRVAKPRRANPNEVLIPQTLLRVSQLLPAVKPGKLRCQVCARGVDGDVRFHPECNPKTPRTFKPKRCKEPSCGLLFTPSGPRSDFCESCR